MTSPASTSELGELHRLVAEELKRRIQVGEATTADLAAALKMLKDNNINAIPTNDNALGQLVKSMAATLPFTNEDDLVSH